MFQVKKTRIRVNRNSEGTFKAYILHLLDKPECHFHPILLEEKTLELAYNKADVFMTAEYPDYGKFLLEETNFKIHPDIHPDSYSTDLPDHL